MKIAISGASGTGKTTLARMISEHYQIPINPIGSRTVAKEMGFDNPYDVDKAGLRVEFQEKLFDAKREWELTHDSFVTDRSYLDNLTYCVLHMAEHLTEEKVFEYQRMMSIYHATVVLSRASFQKLDDGIRQTNAMYHQYYELLLMSALPPRNDLWKLPYEARQIYLMMPPDHNDPESRFRWFQDLEPRLGYKR